MSNKWEILRNVNQEINHALGNLKSNLTELPNEIADEMAYGDTRTDRKKWEMRQAEKPITINGATLSRKEIARRSGLSLSLISRIFGGYRQPSLYSAKLIAWSFGWQDEGERVPWVTIDQLYDHLVALGRGRQNKAQGKVIPADPDQQQAS